MEKLEINKQNVIMAYEAGGEVAKKLLVNLFGGEVFISQKITDRVKTFEDACGVLGLDPGNVLPSGGYLANNIAVTAYAKLVIITRALNEGWKPDWSDAGESKYCPYFKYDNGSSRFVLSGCDYTLISALGCHFFKNRDLASYAGQQFADLYDDFFNK
jgi:hypothetical protein